MARKFGGTVKKTDTVLVTSVDLASADVTGVLPVANGGTGSGSYTDGQLLIGNTASGNTLTKATLTAGTGISVTNGGGSITIASSPSTVTISGKTGAYTVDSTDLGKIINCTSGSFTISLTAAATLGDGFRFWVWNTSTATADVITIDPNSSETIDGSTTLALYRGQGTEVICNGSLFYTGDVKRLRVYAENSNPTSSRPVASGNSSVAIGQSTTASGAQSTAIGPNAVASGQYSVALCCSAAAVASTASGTAGTLAALGGTADASDSMAIGEYSKTRSIVGAKVYASGRYATAGDAQAGFYTLRALTTDATATVLTTNQSAAATTNQIVLPNNSAYTFKALVTSHRTDTVSGYTHRASWSIEGLAVRDANAASTLVSATINTIYNTPGWALAVATDTTNGCVKFTFTGEAAKTIRTVAVVETCEVTS